MLTPSFLDQPINLLFHAEKSVLSDLMRRMGARCRCGRNKVVNKRAPEASTEAKVERLVFLT